MKRQDIRAAALAAHSNMKPLQVFMMSVGDEDRGQERHEEHESEPVAAERVGQQHEEAQPRDDVDGMQLDIAPNTLQSFEHGSCSQGDFVCEADRFIKKFLLSSELRSLPATLIAVCPLGRERSVDAIAFFQRELENNKADFMHVRFVFCLDPHIFSND